MDYMKAYERCMNIARNKSNGGELSEIERESLRLELGMDGRDNSNNGTGFIAGSLVLGTKSGTVSDK